MSTLVMKFGGASVAAPDDFKKIASIILERKLVHQNLVVVVSAMANKTSELIALARQVNPDPPSREYDMLVSVGERISISLLAMALAAQGEKAVSFTGSQSGIMTSDEHSNAQIVEVRPHRLLPILDQGRIAIVAGFQGCSLRGEITTLGINGSDISAVAIGAALSAECVEFYKNVPGVFDKDPRVAPDSKLHSELNFDQALRIVKNEARILHPRCLKLAKKNALPLHIHSFKDPHQIGTKIYDTSLMKGKVPLYENELSHELN